MKQTAPTPQQDNKPVIRHKLNLLLLATFVAVHLLVLFVLPLADIHGLWRPLALVSMAVITTPMWALAHEAIHSQLHPQRAANLRYGRLLGVVFGSPFRLLRHGHLHHHRHSRMEEDRTEIYDPAATSRLTAAAAFYPRLLGGLYLGEVLANIVFLLPRAALLGLLRKVHPADGGPARQRAEAELLAPAPLREIRRDAVMVLAVYGMAFWLYGALWWQLALVLLWRAVLISLVDNSFHYGTPLNDHLYALNLRLPRWAAPLILNFNMHRTHHRQVSLPWHALPGATRYQPEDPAFLNGLLRQLRGPIRLEQAMRLKMPEHWQR